MQILPRLPNNVHLKVDRSRRQTPSLETNKQNAYIIELVAITVEGNQHYIKLEVTSALGKTVSPPFSTSVRYISTVAKRCPPRAILILSTK